MGQELGCPLPILRSVAVMVIKPLISYCTDAATPKGEDSLIVMSSLRSLLEVLAGNGMLSSAAYQISGRCVRCQQ